MYLLITLPDPTGPTIACNFFGATYNVMSCRVFTIKLGDHEAVTLFKAILPFSSIDSSGALILISSNSRNFYKIIILFE